MQEPTFAAFIGLDWADKKHDVCLQAAGSSGSESSVIEHRPAAIAAWADGIRERFAPALNSSVNRRRGRFFFCSPSMWATVFAFRSVSTKPDHSQYLSA